MNNILEHRKFVASQIEKSFGVENDIEKARNVGDVHPNGKWVWTEYAPGKFDWRSKKTRANAQLSGHKPGETKSAAKSNSEAAKIVKKDVPHKDLETYKEVVDYAQTLGYDFKEVQSGFRDKTAKAFELKYNDNLSLNVDFVNNHEYIYEFKNNGKHVFGVNSTKETEKTDWSVLLNPNSWAEKTISAYDNGLKQHTSLMKRYETAYDRMDRRSDYDKYLHEKSLVEYFTNLKTKAGKVVELFNK